MTMAKRLKKPELDMPSEIPNAEQAAKGIFKEEFISPTTSRRRWRHVDQSEIDRQLYAGLLTQPQHEVLVGFYGDLMKAGLVWSPRSTTEPASTSGVGSFIADRLFTRALRVRDQMNALGEAMSHNDRDIVVDALLMDRRVKPQNQALMWKAVDVLEEFY